MRLPVLTPSVSYLASATAYNAAQTAELPYDNIPRPGAAGAQLMFVGWYIDMTFAATRGTPLKLAEGPDFDGWVAALDSFGDITVGSEGATPLFSGGAGESIKARMAYDMRPGDINLPNPYSEVGTLVADQMTVKGFVGHFLTHPTLGVAMCPDVTTMSGSVSTVFSGTAPSWTDTNGNLWAANAGTMRPCVVTLKRKRTIHAPRPYWSSRVMSTLPYTLPDGGLVAASLEGAAVAGARYMLERGGSGFQLGGWQQMSTPLARLARHMWSDVPGYNTIAENMDGGWGSTPTTLYSYDGGPLQAGAFRVIEDSANSLGTSVTLRCLTLTAPSAKRGAALPEFAELGDYAPRA